MPQPKWVLWDSLYDVQTFLVLHILFTIVPFFLINMFLCRTTWKISTVFFAFWGLNLGEAGPGNFFIPILQIWISIRFTGHVMKCVDNMDVHVVGRKLVCFCPTIARIKVMLAYVGEKAFSWHSLVQCPVGTVPASVAFRTLHLLPIFTIFSVNMDTQWCM